MKKFWLLMSFAMVLVLIGACGEIPAEIRRNRLKKRLLRRRLKRPLRNQLKKVQKNPTAQMPEIPNLPRKLSSRTTA